MARHIDNCGRKEYTINYNGEELSPCTVEETVNGNVTTTYMRYFKTDPTLVRRVTETESGGTTTTEDEKSYGNWSDRSGLTYVAINETLQES